MLIDVVRPENWDELNDQVKIALNLDPKVRARCYQGLAQAVFEISQGTAQFMAHKKSIGVIQGQTFVFDHLLPYYYKETYEVAVLSHSRLDNVKEWVESLKKDTNFVIFAEDHPVTGELYPFSEELDKLLNEKRMYSFRVSHARHFHEPAEIRPYSVRICSYTPNAAVALVGERFRSPTLMVQNMSWNANEFLNQISEERKTRSLNQVEIEKTESALSSVATAYFKPGASRLYDRAVVTFQDASAEAIAEVLFKKLGLTSEQGWQKISSTNMCHWSVGQNVPSLVGAEALPRAIERNASDFP